MNLTPEIIDSDVYCIELLDYITADLGNVQPQQLLNKLTYIYNTHTNIVTNLHSILINTIESIDSDYDDIEDDINEIEASNDVVDIVGTYAELLLYNTSILETGDVIKVIADETHDNACTYYRWDGIVFTYDSYERNEIPVTITESVTVSPDYDVTYVVVGSNITVTIDSSNYTIGEHIIFIALSQFNIVYSGVTKTVYPNDTFVLYYIGNDNWTPSYPDVFNKVFPVGTVVLSTLPLSPSRGTWKMIDEGLLLMSGTSDIGVKSGSDSFTVSGITGTVGSHTLVLAEIPSHTHTVGGTTGNVSDGHTHTVASIDKPYGSSKESGSAHADTTGSGKTNGINRNHYHNINGNSTGVSGHSGTTAGHNHSITLNDVTVDVRQKSVALFAFKRTA